MTEAFTVTCDNCEREVHSVYMGVDLPNSGLFFSPNSMGYYAGFFDNFPPTIKTLIAFATTALLYSCSRCRDWRSVCSR